MWINRHICGINIRIIWLTLPEPTSNTNFIPGEKIFSRMENKHTMGKRARKIHQREMEHVNPPICSHLYSLCLEMCWTEITLFSPEARLAMTVVSGTRRTTQDPWSASQPGKGSCQFLGGNQSPGPPSSTSVLEARSGNQSIKKTRHLNILTAKLSGYEGKSCVRWHTTHCREDSGGLWGGWCFALTYLDHLCSVLVKVFIQKQWFLFFPFFPQDPSSSPHLGYCGEIFFIFSHFPSGKQKQEQHAVFWGQCCLKVRGH